MKFSKVCRPCDESPVFLHNNAPIWVVHYPATDVRAEHWQGYRAVAHVPAGRMPWTVDNRRIGGDRGFPSVDLALSAAVATETELCEIANNPDSDGESREEAAALLQLRAAIRSASLPT